VKILKQSAALESEINGEEILRLIEKAGRTCYQSEPKGNAADFVRMLLGRGHESVLEHISISVRVVTDRGISHEIVRHRIASYSQESTRYCRYGDEIQVIEPPELSPIAFRLWSSAMGTCEKNYLWMLEHDYSPQIARSVLPTCLKTEMVMTMNLREWRHFFRLRLALAAHPQMRELAGMIRDLLVKAIPVVFDEFKTLEAA
jgi:thymidylate synthase (FAD)